MKLRQLRYLETFNLKESEKGVWVRGKNIKKTGQYEAWNKEQQAYKWFFGDLEVIKK